MAAVPPITDSLSAPPSSSLVLPPSSSSQPALGLPPTDSTQASTAFQTSLTTPSTQTAAATDTTAATSTAATTDTATPAVASPLASSTNQPLAVVLDALASAGVDTAINQEILAPSLGQPVGTFSIFIEQLFTALAAQSAAAQQSQQAAAAQQATPATAQIQTNSALSAFTTTVPSTAPNSALENDVQTLAQTVNAQNTNPTLAAEAASTSTVTLSPLQQSFDQFIADVGGTQNSANLGGFLQALASNLHAVQSPLGNIVNSQT